jgi:hypothetical protein
LPRAFAVVRLIMRASPEIYMRLVGSLALAALAVLAPLGVPAVLPETTSRSTTIAAVIVAEVAVVVAILAVWFYLRSSRTRASGRSGSQI